jgi:ATP-dependent RNA helicase SUPV3L1/SUV3
MAMNDVARSGRCKSVAVLGPTNTGKTHLAMERMLAHASGMIGFPLRLLARENYDRAVRVKGADRVALITGEEKIVPPNASWFLCTVEAMPIDRRVAFLGVDEVQMCADPDRGHIFTDRLLHARGELETMFIGAETIKPLLRRLVPEAEFIGRPRFSSLTNAGACKLSRLPSRTAIVAFSAADVYTIAELVRRQRGGAALVLGALSPRTRNAQVAMYQGGEVDYLVATDAIGMGLNMHVDHVAFAATRKFDGRGPRSLTAAEMAQIAGRAGRYTKDGSFGTTAELGPLDAELAERIESHHFEPLTALKWRNSALQFVSIAALRRSLARLPTLPGLVRAREADDELALAHLAQDAEIARLARGPEAVGVLWDVCCIPDFGKVTGEGHARLLARMFRFLVGAEGERKGRLPTDWVARQVDRLNRTDGDIETLMQRIANVRTWTYVSHRAMWLDDAKGWQQRTRTIEDKLSDALHERLIHRFVDRRTALLVGRLQGTRNLVAQVNVAGEVHVEGHFVGTLEGFQFAPDPAVAAGYGPRDAGRSVRAAALRALGEQIRQRLAEFEEEDDRSFTLDDDGGVHWRSARVAQLRPGRTILQPGIDPLASDLLEAEAKVRIATRLSAWLRRHLRRSLAPLFRAEEAALSAPARGLVYQVAETLGSLPRRRAATQVASLTRDDRRTLGRCGLRLGRESVFFPRLLRPEAMKLRALLWALHRGVAPFREARCGRPSLARHAGTPEGFYEAIGYRVLGTRAVRVDVLEKLIATTMRLAQQNAPATEGDLAGLLDCDLGELMPTLIALGYRVEVSEAGIHVLPLSRGRRRALPRRRGASEVAQDPHSPFAVLNVLRSAQ